MLVGRLSDRGWRDLFLISILILFLELACIRWFAAHVVFLTFFTNVVLLAAFLGMSIGCLLADRPRNHLAWTPLVLAAALAIGLGLEALMEHGARRFLDVGTQARPQMVFFGAEEHTDSLATLRVPMEAVAGFFFVMIALVFVGPGQELGRALNRASNRVLAYTVNIAGSVVGIVLFGLLSFLQLSAFWWFLPVAAGLAYFLGALEAPAAGRGRTWLMVFGPLAVCLAATGLHSSLYRFPDSNGRPSRVMWSPYYRIDYRLPPTRYIRTNLIAHQMMRAADYPSPEYALPHLLDRDSRRHLGLRAQPFADVMVIGAGSGNDVARALQFGATHVDAVEIDPVIQHLGALDHPMAPYADPRVSVHLDDGRNFLHRTDKKYDLIIYALVDSLVLHSGYSNIRLESYLFTKQAFEDVRSRLKPGGVFVTYNYFRQGWIVARLAEEMNQVFGQNNALVFTWPGSDRVEPETSFSGFSVVFGGEGAGRLRQAFYSQGAGARPADYWLAQAAPGPQSPDGFRAPGAEERGPAWRFRPAEVVPPQEPLRIATDDWPFLYLRRAMIPDLSVRGMAVMAVLGLGLLLAFCGRGFAGGGVAGGSWGAAARFFFLGAGFMLVETKAVVHMALLFGSTWVVNSVVFFSVLVMILLANLFVLRFRPFRIAPYAVGLLLSLAASALVPLDGLLGYGRAVQVVASLLLVGTPIMFAGVIFAVSFARAARPDQAFGANIAGAMLGGLSENVSMLVGFQYLVLVALAFYLLALPFDPATAKRSAAPADDAP